MVTFLIHNDVWLGPPNGLAASRSRSNIASSGQVPCLQEADYMLIESVSPETPCHCTAPKKMALANLVLLRLFLLLLSTLLVSRVDAF